MNLQTNWISCTSLKSSAYCDKLTAKFFLDGGKLLPNAQIKLINHHLTERYHLSMHDKIDTIAETIEVAAEIIREAREPLKQETDQSLIVLSGCGTSGRIAFFCATAFNRVLESHGARPVFRYLISGGDRALISSREKVEDDPFQGAEELTAVSARAKRVLYIGITCGFRYLYLIVWL